MAKQNLTPSELVMSHKPKNFKYCYIIKDDEFLKYLENDKEFDMETLDTIKNEELVHAALRVDCTLYERTIIGKAKEPTIIGDGVIVSKKMVTKADKKLQQFGLGYFDYQEMHCVVMRMYYEKFDIIEIFVLT